MQKKIFILAFLVTVTIGTMPADRPKVGLVLGGGGAKGFAHIVLLELLEEMEIPVDIVIGVSAGAIAGGLYSAGYSPALIKDSLLDIDWTSIILDIPVKPFEKELGTGDMFLSYDVEAMKRGISSGQMTYALFKTLTAKIPSYIDFDTLPIPFRAGVVKIPEGRVELIGEGDLAEAIRASMSIPGLFDPFDIDGKSYIDGGTLDNLPIRLARELGCEIIIASDLYPDLKSINTSPLEVPELILSIYWNTINKEQHPLADAVIEANVQNFSMMDFPKSHEIYSQVSGEKEKIRFELEKIKELLSPFERERRLSYGELPFLTPVSLTITGVLPRDRDFIERNFTRFLKDKPLESARLEDFIRKIYEIGNYRFVAARLNDKQGKTELELLLYPNSYKGLVWLFGGNYQGIFSEAAVNKLSMQGGVQIQGLSGPGSVLFLGASWVNLLSFGMVYLQPLSPQTFVIAQTEIMLDHNITSSGFSWKDPDENRLAMFTAELSGGFYINRNTAFKAGALFFAANPQAQDGRNKAFGFKTNFTYNDLDYLFYPSSGIYASLENRFCFPLPFDPPWFFDIVSLDLKGALPLGSGFSISGGVFAGLEPGSKLSRLEGLSAGFTAFDRQYFPNVYGIDNFYSYKAAAALALQYMPWKNLSILGGQLFFSVSASAGELFNELEDFSFDELISNVSFNIGLRLKKNYGIMLRFGIGSNGSSSPAPFLAFDLGQAMRSGIKPGY